MALSLVFGELLSIDATVTIQIQIAKARHLHTFAVLLPFVHSLAVSFSVLRMHGFTMRLLTGD